MTTCFCGHGRNILITWMLQLLVLPPSLRHFEGRAGAVVINIVIVSAAAQLLLLQPYPLLSWLRYYLCWSHQQQKAMAGCPSQNPETAGTTLWHQGSFVTTGWVAMGGQPGFLCCPPHSQVNRMNDEFWTIHVCLLPLYIDDISLYLEKGPSTWLGTLGLRACVRAWAYMHLSLPSCLYLNVIYL